MKVQRLGEEAQQSEYIMALLKLRDELAGRIKTKQE